MGSRVKLDFLVNGNYACGKVNRTNLRKSSLYPFRELSPHVWVPELGNHFRIYNSKVVH
jgi:hypothetical protein